MKGVALPVVGKCRQGGVGEREEDSPGDCTTVGPPRFHNPLFTPAPAPRRGVVKKKGPKRKEKMNNQIPVLSARPGEAREFHSPTGLIRRLEETHYK